MDGLLTAVKTVTRDSTKSLEPTSETHHISREQSLKPSTKLDYDAAISSSDYVRNVLRSGPDGEQLAQVLNLLDPSTKHADSSKDFDIRVPGPVSAQILQILTSTTIPHHWDALNADPKGKRTRESKSRAALLRSLSSVSGLSSILAQLRLLIAAASHSPTKGSGNKLHVRALLSVLSALLKPVDFISRIYTDIFTLYGKDTQKQVVWRELVSLVAASKVLSTAAEALTLIAEEDVSASILWIGNGFQYTSWLGENVNYMVSRTNMDDQLAFNSIAFLTGRALSLGYTGNNKLLLS